MEKLMVEVAIMAAIQAGENAEPIVFEFKDEMLSKIIKLKPDYMSKDMKSGEAELRGAAEISFLAGLKSRKLEKDKYPRLSVVCDLEVLEGEIGSIPVKRYSSVIAEESVTQAAKILPNFGRDDSLEMPPFLQEYELLV